MRLSNWYVTGFCAGFLVGHWLKRRGVLVPVPHAAFVPPVTAAKGYLSQPHDQQDLARAEFLRRLAGAPLAVTSWEALFITSNIGRVCFTEKQKAVIDGLRAKYQSRL